ncbi:helix-turn-helix transcriptional regulator [Candidatus Curtissbacteria bacterium]|nr:helix-turn-helix transcriptional regulator [Candidatus Curtissbacteria bacterium]
MKKVKLISAEALHKKWMKDPEYRREYERLAPEFEIARQIIDARVKRKITQEELAKRMGTGQAVISRLETANAKPSLSLIQRLADALNLKVELRFTQK